MNGYSFETQTDLISVLGFALIEEGDVVEETTEGAYELDQTEFEYLVTISAIKGDILFIIKDDKYLKFECAW